MSKVIPTQVAVLLPTTVTTGSTTDVVANNKGKSKKQQTERRMTSQFKFVYVEGPTFSWKRMVNGHSLISVCNCYVEVFLFRML